MGFFLFRREGDHVELMDARVFSSRSEAVAEVARLAQDQELGLGEFFVADIDAAAPVVVIHATVVAASPEGFTPAPVDPSVSIAEPASEHWPAPADEPAMTTESAGEPDAAISAVVEVEEAIAEAVLAGAAPAPDVDEAASAAVVDIASEPVIPAQNWPWDAPEAPDHADEPQTAEVFPVADTTPTDTAETTSDLDSSASDPPASVTSLLADLEEIAPVATEPSEPEAVAEPSEPEAVADAEPPEMPAEQEVAEPDTPPRVYEPGTSDITELTCEDCIYINTCPKKGESDPSSCGSFQWRSV
ncbi:MAG TPA: hypothetical protein VFH17_04370 [Coriobacteriia bacterium]|nr:hypothetical protein [Coriobacteriia bacterium]